MQKSILAVLILAFTLGSQACTALSPVVRTADVENTPLSLVNPTATPAPAATSTQRGSVQKDVTYCTIRGTDLKMDLYYPREGEEPFPAVVYIHGGGWSEGDKEDMEGIVGARELMERGYLLVSLNYRLAPGFRFPSMIEDVKCAIRSLKANAGEWSLDPEQIGVMGSSAGGHLAALLGTADESAGWDTGSGYDQPYLDQSSQVHAVVNLFGPADLQALFAVTAQNLAQAAFGVRRASDPFLAQASPINYVSAGDAPFLILHGTLDAQVPLEQSQALHAALSTAGVDSTLVVVEQAGHGFPRSGQAYSPGFDELAAAIANFYDEHLAE